MSAPAPPTVPPRPGRAEKAAAHGVDKLPDMPPRPVSKRLERAVSPAHYPGSPLNEPYHLARSRSTEPQPPRNPSVAHLPTPGEEGMEYANIPPQLTRIISALNDDDDDVAAHTRRVGDDLHLHAPKPSLPKEAASAQVEAVARTGSAQAAAHGLEQVVTRTKSRGSFSRPGSAVSAPRRSSIDLTDEHGPAELGMRVPINPHLGDVQAPSPAGLSPQVTGDSTKRHGRKKSAFDDYRPPGSYGLHGHGVLAENKFERDWYAKHPEQLEHEEGHGHGVYAGIGSGRGSFALSSNELNKLVRDTASRGAGLGTREDIKSYPDEQIGYIASEEYQQRSRQNTPAPLELSRTQTQLSQPAAESPLRKASFPADDVAPAEIKRSKQFSLQKSDPALESEGEDYHVDSPRRRYNKITGGEETIDETEDAKPYVSHAEDGGAFEYRVPILAEDEVAKHVGGEHLQPAISPRYERRGSSYMDDHGSGAHTPGSRPSSRPGSIYNLHSASHSLSRFLSHQDDRDHLHTPLEDVAEYEPLFPDDDGKKALSHAERFKRRPELSQKRFPSQDIWEDTPNSAMYVAEVSTPDLPSTATEPRLEASSAFEPPEKESARKEEVSEQDKRQLVSREERLAKSKWAPHLRDDMPTRPDGLQRFPSRDIWEDSPDYSQLVTTVSSPPIDDGETSPVDAKPPVPARPAKSRLAEGASASQAPPSIPARPPKRLHAVPPADAQLTEPIPLSKEVSPTELKRVPSIPDRPKPQIPPRPTKKHSGDSLTQVMSAGSSESAETALQSPPTVKAKPQVPPRPAGGNLAGIKGNFMNDLNKKLGLGPPKEKEKEPEPETERKPLEDARKGRARGPQRRAPAKSPSAAAAVAKPTMSFSMFSAQSVWQIDDTGSLHVGTAKAKETLEENQIAQFDHAATTDDLPPSTQETVTKTGPGEVEEQEEPKPLISDGADVVDEPAEENPEGELTRKTTASTISGQPLAREETDPNADAIPASRQTTATDSDANEADERLERVQTEERPPTTTEKKVEDEPIQIRNEQLSAAAPDESSTGTTTTQPSISTQDENSNPAQQPAEKELDIEGNPGSDAPKEPMNEEDVNYKKLEEMTAKADGKLHAEEEPQAANGQFTSRKVVD